MDSYDCSECLNRGLFFYFHVAEVLRKWFTDTSRPIDEIDPVGNSPVIIKKVSSITPHCSTLQYKQCSTAQYTTAQRQAKRYSTVQDRTVQDSTVQSKRAQMVRCLLYCSCAGATEATSPSVEEHLNGDEARQGRRQGLWLGPRNVSRCAHDHLHLFVPYCLYTTPRNVSR